MSTSSLSHHPSPMLVGVIAVMIKYNINTLTLTPLITKVKNAIHAVANVDDYGASARLLAATTLR